MASILDKLKKNTTIKHTSVLSESVFFSAKDMIPLAVPALNVALSGDLDGGLTPGVTMWAGPSKHFKTLFSLICAKAYLEKYPDATLLFYDSEFGTPIGYFSALGIDIKRVLHVPLTNVEELKFDIMAQLDQITRGDKVVIVVDSIGNLASKKEVDDAMKQSDKADMTRAKQIKSLFRMVTPHLNLKDIPMIVVNHTYKTLELYAKDVVGGGTGSYYSSDNIFIVGRRQDKDGDEVVGYEFIIKVEKSRYVREKSLIPITVSFDDGVSAWSGLLDLALESKHVTKVKNGWYAAVDQETGEYDDALAVKTVDTDTAEFWQPILQDKSFKDFIRSKYRISQGNLINSTEIDADE